MSSITMFQDRTLVGGGSAADIQLSGLGIQPEHCLLLVEGSGLHMEPLNGARCFVNGAPVVNRIRLGHADRILWGNHHFFRVNCPKATCESFLLYFLNRIQLHDKFCETMSTLRVHSWHL